MSELSNRTKDWFSSQNKKFTNSFNKENLVGTTTTGLGILGNTISSASKLSQTADTSSLEAEIQDVKNFNPSAFNNNSLLNEWSNRNVLDRVSYDEIRGLQGSDIGSSIASNTLSGVTQGASAGGLWGGLIGGAISAIDSGIGALIGHNKTLDEQRRLNKEIEQANKATTESFQHRASEIDTNQDYNLLANYSAYGGPIHIDKNKIGSFTREADKRGLGIQEFANKVLAHKNNYSTSMVKKANFAINASKWYDAGGSLEEDLSPEDFISQKINEKRIAALDKSRNRTSIRVPKIPNSQTKEQWNTSRDLLTDSYEEEIRKAKSAGNLRLAKDLQEYLDKQLAEEYKPLVLGPNCMYNAGDCYGLNIPGNLTFATKHKELGFKKVSNDNLEPGDLVQDVRNGYPRHAMIYDSKDNEGNLLFNYARGYTIPEAAYDMKYNYVKQGKYPMDNYDVYRYVGTPADSTQWVNEYNEMYNNKKAKGGPLKDSEYYSIMERVAKDNYKKWGFKNSDEALAHALNDNTYNYRGYYSKYPKSKANADTHWTDEFKTVYHPTFSNKSVYSGKVSQYNPEGLVGGSWDGETFIPADWQNKKAEGGNLFTNGVTTIGNGGTHEQNPHQGIQLGVDTQGIPNLVEEGEVIWNDYVFSNRIKVPKKLQDKYKVKNLTFAEAVKKLQKESEERPNDPISKNTLTSLLTSLQEEQEQIRMKKEINKLNKQYAHGGKLGNLFSGLGPQNNTLDKSDSVEPLDPIKKGASWLRYAPVVGSTIGLMESALSTPDYTHANAIERAARNASRYTPVGFTPIMNYMQYNPFDKNYYTNKLQSESGATRRAITNMGGPSRQAALLAADYNAQTKLGELFRQAEEYNLNQRQKVDEFNRATNMFNKEKGIQVALANQNQEAAGKQLGLQGIMASANMRENMDTARAQSIAQNTSNLFTNLGNIGQDEANRDMQKFYLRTTGTNLPLNEYASIFGIQDAKKEAAKRGYTPSQITTLFSKY